jgi:hypothetical protein
LSIIFSYCFFDKWKGSIPSTICGQISQPPTLYKKSNPHSYLYLTRIDALILMEQQPKTTTYTLPTLSRLLLPVNQIEHTVPCPELGEGWTRRIVARKKTKASDVYYVHPDGRHFRSTKEVVRYFNGETVVVKKWKKPKASADGVSAVPSAAPSNKTSTDNVSGGKNDTIGNVPKNPSVAAATSTSLASKPSEKADADASSADTTKTDNPVVMANNNNSFDVSKEARKKAAAATSSTGGGQVTPTGKTRVHEEEDGKAKAKPVAAWQRTSPRCHCCFCGNER